MNRWQYGHYGPLWLPHRHGKARGAGQAVAQLHRHGKQAMAVGLAGGLAGQAHRRGQGISVRLYP